MEEKKKEHTSGLLENSTHGRLASPLPMMDIANPPVFYLYDSASAAPKPSQARRKSHLTCRMRQLHRNSVESRTPAWLSVGKMAWVTWASWLRLPER